MLIIVLVISVLLLLQGLVLPLVPGGPAAPGRSCSLRYPQESLIDEGFPARLCSRFPMMLEVSCTRGLLLEAEDYEDMSLVNLLRFFKDLCGFMRL